MQQVQQVVQTRRRAGVRARGQKRRLELARRRMTGERCQACSRCKTMMGGLEEGTDMGRWAMNEGLAVMGTT